jgi:hypothetical protein
LAPACLRQTLSITAQPQEPGIWRLQGGLAVHPTWVLETGALAGLNHPLLTLVSPTFLTNAAAAYELLRQGGATRVGGCSRAKTVARAETPHSCWHCRWRTWNAWPSSSKPN